MNAVEAGRLAKAQGHDYERDLTDTMNEMFGGDHVTMQIQSLGHRMIMTQ